MRGCRSPLPLPPDALRFDRPVTWGDNWDVRPIALPALV